MHPKELANNLRLEAKSRMLDRAWEKWSNDDDLRTNAKPTSHSLFNLTRRKQNKVGRFEDWLRDQGAIVLQENGYRYLIFNNEANEVSFLLRWA